MQILYDMKDKAMTEKYIPKKGDYVSLGGVFSGITQEVYTSESGERIAKIFLVKNAFQRGSSELHNLSSPLLGDIQPATKEDLLREIAMRQAALEKSLEEFDVQKDWNSGTVWRIDGDVTESHWYVEHTKYAGSASEMDKYADMGDDL